MKNSERDVNTRPPDLPLENLYAGQEATVRTGREQQTGSKRKRSMSRLYIGTLLI